MPPRRRHPSKPDQHSDLIGPDHAALRALLRAGGHLRRHSESHFARYGLSPAQWGVLRALERLDEAGLDEPRMYELAEALLVHPPSLSATLERMRRDGLITRRADPDDHRTRRVGLAPAGRRLLTDAQSSHNLWIRTLMGGVSPAQLKTLERILSKLNDHMKRLADDDADAPKRAARRPSRSDE